MINISVKNIISFNIMERADIIYNETEEIVINEPRKQAISQFKIIDVLNSNISNINQIHKGKSIIYPCQEKTAYKIMNAFSDKKVLSVMVVQPTQSGKTGVMFAVSKLFIENPLCMTNPNNIFIISGLSSIDWKKQTIDRFPDIISKNIFHRNNLAMFLETIRKDPRNALIIWTKYILQVSKDKQYIKYLRKHNYIILNFYIKIILKYCNSQQHLMVVIMI